MASRSDRKRTLRTAREYVSLLVGMTEENRGRALADLEHRRGPERVRSRVVLRAVRLAILELCDRLGVPRDGGRRAAGARLDALCACDCSACRAGVHAGCELDSCPATDAAEHAYRAGDRAPAEELRGRRLAAASVTVSFAGPDGRREELQLDGVLVDLEARTVDLGGLRLAAGDGWHRFAAAIGAEP